MLLNAKYTPFPFVSLEGDVLVSLDDGSSPRYYERGEVKARGQFMKRTILAELSGRIELQHATDFAIQESLLDGGLSLWYRGRGETPTKINSRISYQLGDSFTREFLNSALSVQTHLTRDFLLSLSYHGRYALDSLGAVPFYTADEYVSTSNILKGQGMTGPVNNNNYLITSGIEVAYAPKDFVPSFSETLLMKNSSIGIFGQAIWFEEDVYIPHFLFGLKMGTTFSLLGLKELSSSLYVAYDTLEDGVTFGINLGVTKWN